jgi:TonB family protein
MRPRASSRANRCSPVRWNARLFVRGFFILAFAASDTPRTYCQSKTVVSSTLSQSDHLVRYVKPRCPAGIHVAQTVVVKLHVAIKKDGTVEDIEFVEGDSRFRHEALQAVKAWKYKPVVVQGARVEIKTNIDLAFSCP